MMISRVFGLILITYVILPGTTQAYGGDDPNPVPERTWTIRNLCHEPILLAVNYQKLNGRVVTRGWWHLPTQGEVKIEMLSEWIGYLAVTQSGKNWWWDPNGPKFGVVLGRNFTFPGHGTGREVPTYGFHWISVIEQPIQQVSCP